MTEKVYKEDVFKDALDSIIEGIQNRISVKISEREKQAIKDLICSRVYIYQSYYQISREEIIRNGDNVYYIEKQKERAAVEIIKDAAEKFAYEQDANYKYGRGKKFTVMFFK